MMDFCRKKEFFFRKKPNIFRKKWNIFPAEGIFFHRERLSRKNHVKKDRSARSRQKNVNQIFQSDVNVRKIEVSENWCVLCMQSNQMDIQMCLLH